ncbi:metal-dependent hydrolase [Paenibacillus xerothermodurans]|uniref:Metal-dependent hydrolase n=1 Tax=Paenibacillus xerothermodurans TaxID=1977292 RepID=A0A2W1NQW4_PAEXE|nr:metal-dependent hydrolase [Paenibacillus xerothermodurans]PZE21263.1 metal-dependent hydrolase [Paenibacillus xerothermodurans]
MDSGTHLVIGFGLAGLAYIDPIVASNPAVATAVLVGTVVGSQAPDFDTLLRFKSNASYIKNHRGLSHSLPAVVIWTGLITLALMLVFQGLPVGHIALWVFVAVAFHVFTDLFNTYGTQALRPFSHKWVSWNIIHIFDPVIFLSHIVAIFTWSVHLARPQIIFPLLYAFLAVYYVWRSWHHYRLESRLYQQDPQYADGDRYFLIPTFNLQAWQIVKRRSDGHFILGEYRNRRIQWVDEVACAVHPAVEASKLHKNVAAFLYFSSFACAELRSHEWGYEVRWADVRYRHRKQYPFVAVVLLDQELQPIDSYVGWVSETRLGKKLRANT